MKALVSFYRLPAKEKYLLATAALVLSAIRLALRLVPFRVLRRLLKSRRRRSVGIVQSQAYTVDRIAWAVGLCSRRVAEPTCLAQALAAVLLLKHVGHDGHLRIGVAKDEGGKLQAHAWVESNGRVVVGGITALSHFTVLSSPNEDGF
jgi:hypothetical protein